MSNRDHLPVGETLETYTNKILKTLPNGSVTYRESAALKALIEQLTVRVNSLEHSLMQIVDAEWMVTHDWGGDRESILNSARELLK